MFETQAHVENAILVGVKLTSSPDWEPQYSLDELEALADTAGIKTLTKMTQVRHHIDPATFIGRGKVKEIRMMAESLSAHVVVFDTELSPAQIKNLEKQLEIPTLDRSDIILSIFARRARTREAKIQVELAQLKYALPRLKSHWSHLERQVGGVGVRGGPGEKQIEVDRRLVRHKIDKLEDELKTIERQRQIRNRNRSDHFSVALIGYTNVGKSTLFNRLTQAEVLVENRLFATLDSTVRSVSIRKHKFLLTDTVGFIRKLPHHLVASFRSTLEEACQADLLLHVVDMSSPVLVEQMVAVEEVLKQLKIGHKPTIYVLNKCDKLSAEAHADVLQRLPEGASYISISAQTGANQEQLEQLLVETLTQLFKEETFVIPMAQSKWIAQAYAIGTVLNEEYLPNGYLKLTCRGPVSELDRFSKNWSEFRRTLKQTDLLLPKTMGMGRTLV